MGYMALSVRRAIQRPTFLAAIVSLASLGVARSAAATTIWLNLGPSMVTSNVNTSVDVLNGTTLQGQTLSLDFQFLNGKFVRLFSITSDSFLTLLRLQTNGSGTVGFLDGTGYLIDQQGNPLQQPQQLGSASGDNGSIAAGLFPLLPGELQRPLDFFGIHLDLTFPVNPFVSITGGELALKSDVHGPFGIGPGIPRDIVPEADNTFFLLGLGLLGTVVARWRLARVS